MKHFFLCLGCWLLLTVPGLCLKDIAVPEHWPHVKSAHFIIYYSDNVFANEANQVLTKAEEYYERISYRLGIINVQDFWTWDNRVKIILYPTVKDFTSMTGQPSWSEGFAAQHTRSPEQRYIVSFVGQERFLTRILPHELGHLVLHDLMENKPVPVFVDEGVAQLEEERDDAQFKPIMASLVNQHKHIPLSDLVKMRPGKSFNSLQASIFYAESLYIIDFLIKTYGKDKFIELCRLMRNGLDFDEAVLKAYYPMFQDLGDLEEKWKAFLQENAHVQS